MPNISRTKTWNANETLTAANLNAEFDGILTGVNDNALNNDNLSQTDDYLFGSLVLGAGVAAGSGDGKLHVHVSSAGSVAAHADANDLVLESSANTGMTIFAGTSSTASIHFGDSGDNDIGKIVYDHNANDMAFTVGTTADLLLLTSSAATFLSTLTVGVNDTGHDVQFFGATAGSHLLWDESADSLLLTDSTPLKIGDSQDLTLYHDGSNSYITNAVGALKIATETSGIAVTIGHTTSEVTVADNLTVTGTLTLGSGAELTEAELEYLDGITAGTVAASKAVVVDSNKDAASFRNVTLTGELDAATLDISGNADIDGTTNLDAVDIDGAVQIDATVSVGVDDQGYDVKFFGDTASAYLLWDTSADKLLTAGGASVDIVKDKLLIGGTAVTTTAAELNVLDAVTAGTVSASLGVVVDSNKDIGSFRNITLTGELDAGSLDVSGDVDIDGTTNLDAVDIDGTVQIDGTVTVGANTDGYDVKFFGNSSGSSLLWDESADDLIFTNAGIAVGSDATGDVYYRNSSGFLTRLAAGSDADVLTLASGVPSWATPSTGDITGVTAGNGLSGGGTSGGVTLALDLSELTDTAIANGDYIVFTDTTDSNATVKGDLADVATLFAGTGLTASSSVISIDAAQTGIDSLLATDIKIGEDDQTKIDFETANQINLYSNNSVAMEIDSSQNTILKPGDGGGLKFYAGGTGHGNYIRWSDDSGSNNQGSLGYDHSANAMVFYTSAAEAMRIDSSNHVSIGNLASPDGTLHVHSATAGSVTAHADHDDLIVENSDDVGITMLCPAAYHGGIAVGDADQNRRGWLIYDNGTSLNGVSDSWSFGTAATERMVIGNGGTIGIGGDVSSPYDTIGLHINQAGNDDTTLQIVSTDISHGLNSAYYGAYDSDAYMAIRKQHASQGGLTLTALGTDSALTNPMVIQVLGGTAQTSKNTSGIGLMDIVCAEHNGSGALSDITADGNIFSVRCRVSTSLAAKFLVDEDGDIYYDGSAAAYDSMADAELVRTFDTVMAPKEIIQSKWDEDVRYNEQSLIDAGILGGPVIGVPHDERGMVCMTQLQRLHNGAIWQTHTEVQQMKEDFALKLDEKEARISALETQIQGLLN